MRLLSDLRDLYARHGTDRLATVEILKELTALEEAPWSDLWGKPLDARRLAKELDRYKVKSGPIRITGVVVKGYTSTGEHGLSDAWARYLPPQAVTPVTGATSQVRPVTAPEGVTAVAVTEQLAVTPDKPLSSTVTAVTAVTPRYGSSASEGLSPLSRALAVNHRRTG